MIVGKNIIKRYEKVILNKFSYEFNNGVYLITGKSGSGKSSLLNILAGADTNYEGSVLVDGSILYIKDKDNLVSNLTVKEHFDLFEKVNNKEIVFYFDVSGFLHTKTKYLSLGQKQIVGLIIALNSDAQNIVMDEPLSALTKENVKKACNLILSLGKRKTVILTGHNIGNIFCSVSLKSREESCHDFGKHAKKIQLKFSFLLIYFKKLLFKKALFIMSLFFSLFSSFCVNNYVSHEINKYSSIFIKEEGVIVGRSVSKLTLNENLFYDVVHQLSKYVVNYNANYYSYSFYNDEVMVGDYYLDNGFILGNIEYSEEYFKDNEVALGLNYNLFCEDNNIYYCDENYIKSLLVNKKIGNTSFYIGRIFGNDKNILFTNKRFISVKGTNDYSEYYFDILKDNEEDMFSYILDNPSFDYYDFILIGESERYYRYQVKIGDKKYYSKISHDDYVVCLDEGYNCFNYLNHFSSLINIDNKNIDDLKFSIIEDSLKEREIIISSSLANKLNKGKGDIISLYFRYLDGIKTINLFISDIKENENNYLYQSSSWSRYLFKDLLGYKSSDLRIKNIIIYDEKNNDEYYEDNLYNSLIDNINSFFYRIKKIVFITSLFMGILSSAFLVFLEIYDNKFKKEYFAYLSLLNVEIKKHS